MALPNDVRTASLHFGRYIDRAGEPMFAGMSGRIRATSNLLHVPTGDVIVNTWLNFSLDDDGEATVSNLPIAGQASLSPSAFQYVVEWVDQPLGSAAPPALRFQFSVPAGTAVDYDRMTQSPVEPILVPAISGKDGSSAYEVAVANGYSGTVQQWLASLAATAPVTKVNNKVGDVTLTFSDVGAQPAGNYATSADVSAASSADRARANHTGTQSLDTTTDSATRLALTSAERTKLSGVATGATANSTDAQLRDRSTHTGTQAATTIAGLATVATTGAYADLSGKPTAQTAGHTIRDEGVAIAQRAVLDFVGAGVTVTDDGTKTTVTVLQGYQVSASVRVGEWVVQPAFGVENTRVPGGELRLSPLWLPAGTYDAVTFWVDSVGSTGSVTKVIAYADSDTTPGRPGTPLVDTAGLDTATTAGAKVASGLALAVPPGGALLHAGLVNQGGATTPPSISRVVRTAVQQVVAESFPYTSLYDTIARGLLYTGITGAAPATLPAATRISDGYLRLAFRRSA